MKYIFLLATLLSAVSITAQVNQDNNGQIVIEEFPIRLEADVNDHSSHELVSATSACGEVKTTLKETLFSGGCLGTIVREYTFTDTCGNKANANQYIRLTDIEAPVFVNFPNDTIVKAKKVPVAADPICSDNSGEKVRILFDEEITESKIIRTWTAFDQCNNNVKKSQTITLK